MKALDKLSVSIVNYNSGDYLLKCLKSLDRVRGEIELEIWVVDNSSTDDSLSLVKKAFPEFNYIENKQNLGFGKAHNQVFQKINTKFILILNPDTEFKKGDLGSLLRYMDNNPQVGVLTCKVVLPDGSLDWASHRGFPTPLASLLYFIGDDSLYHLSKMPMDKPHEVDAISGSFFLIRKSVLDQVGLFDEDYFMYAEDIDLCFRIKQAGYKIMFNPSLSIIHHKGVSSGLKKHSRDITTADTATRKRALDAFYQTMKIFYNKHYAKHNLFVINWLVYFGISLKWWLAKRKLTV